MWTYIIDLVPKITGIGICSYIAYKTYYYGKYKFNSFIMDKVNQELNKRLKNEEEEGMFKLVHKNSSALVTVKHAGKTDSVYIPYNRNISTKMIGKKVSFATWRRINYR
jgi:hypothetical protein